MEKLSVKNRDSMREFFRNRGEESPEKYNVTDKERKEEADKVLKEYLENFEGNYKLKNPETKIF